MLLLLTAVHFIGKIAQIFSLNINLRTRRTVIKQALSFCTLKRH